MTRKYSTFFWNPADLRPKLTLPLTVESRDALGIKDYGRNHASNSIDENQRSENRGDRAGITRDDNAKWSQLGVR